MKRRTFFANQYFCFASAALVIAAGTLWMLLAYTAEQLSPDTVEQNISCEVSVFDSQENDSPKQIYCLHSRTKVFSASLRRSIQNVSTPFILFLKQDVLSNASKSAALLPSHSKPYYPANSVRAGPRKY